MTRAHLSTSYIRVPTQSRAAIALQARYQDYDKALDALMGDGSASPVETLDGAQRSITIVPGDKVVSGSKTFTVANGAFTGGDVGRKFIVASSVSNNKTFTIASVTSATVMVVTESATNETFTASATMKVYALDRSITHGADSVVAGTKTWIFASGAFSGPDVGKKLIVAGASNSGNNATFTIASVTNGTTIVTTESPAADETFGGGVTQSIWALSRNITAKVADKVVSSTKTFTLAGGAFVAGDVGRKLYVVGTAGATNDGTYTIATITSSTVIVVTESVAADETFTAPTIAVYDENRVITHNASDAVVASTKTFTFVNGAFTTADVGRKIILQKTANSGANDGLYTIASRTSSTVVVVTETVAANETFGASVLQSVVEGGDLAGAVLDVTIPVSLLDATAGTTQFDLPNGTYVGQRKVVRTLTASTSVVLHVKTLLEGAKITYSTLNQYTDFVWTPTGWAIVENIGGTIS